MRITEPLSFLRVANRSAECQWSGLRLLVTRTRAINGLCPSDFASSQSFGIGSTKTIVCAARPVFYRRLSINLTEPSVGIKSLRADAPGGGYSFPALVRDSSSPNVSS
ncbi:hypothetical protein AWB69_08049 [Caballeronia udeis]|uniref:Uncharacterized protein n=1 Tax=Caballeronia udeis TaxID=1232866 RepID=A0A158JJG9_9BURK|nr:hypothetical protein AWB69_08049 [Caballeronia udeis]